MRNRPAARTVSTPDAASNASMPKPQPPVNAPAPCVSIQSSHASAGSSRYQASHAQPGHRIHGDELAHQPVEPERCRQQQRDPRKAAVVERQPQHAEGGDANRDPLHPVQPLAQQRHAQQHVEQRIDEVAEAGLDHVARVHRPDVQAPVERDQQSAQRQHRRRARLAQDRREPAAALLPEQPGADERRAPDHAMQHDLQRRHRLEQVPVQRHQTPQREGAGRSPQPAPVEQRAVHPSRPSGATVRGAGLCDFAFASVIATTPASTTAIAPMSCTEKRSAASQAPSSTAMTGLT